MMKPIQSKISEVESETSIEGQVLEISKRYDRFAFWTLVGSADIREWVLVIGERLDYEGVEFGAYRRHGNWWVVDLDSGCSIGYVDNLAGVYDLIEHVIGKEGMNKYKEKVAEVIQRHPPLPKLDNLDPLFALMERIIENLGMDKSAVTQKKC